MQPGANSRIAVTGLGLVTPHGGDVVASWEEILRGARAVRRVQPEELGPGAHGVNGAPSAWSGAPAAGVRHAEAHAAKTEPVLDLARRAASEAIAQAGLISAPCDPDRSGVVFGTSKGGLDSFARDMLANRSGQPGSREPGASWWTVVPPSAAAAHLAAEYGWRGPAVAPVAACATGLVCLIRAAALLREGHCDVVVAGSSDAALQPSLLASFRRLGVLAPPTADPAVACRPFDVDRRGFLVGEGAGAVVLERWEHASARGVPILAEWVDGLERGDPEGLTLLPDDPAALVRLIADVLRRAELSTTDIDAVSLHGTGTRMNDAYEGQALARVFGSRLDRLTGFGVKGGIGHLLGAAGSVEAVLSVCALRDQRIPPTVNCETPDPVCGVPLVRGAAVARPLSHVLKLSLGFGGHLAAGVFRRAAASEPDVVAR